MLYVAIRGVAKLLLGEFFRRITRIGAAPVEQGPVIVVANHPNYMLDTFIVATSYRRPLSFMAMAPLFDVPVLGYLLRTIGSVPVHRPQDGAGTVGNEASFRSIVERLLSGGAVAIFPEGVSLGERALAPVKTGAARIAPQAENAKGFALGLTIQPVGLTYTELQRFRSAVTVSFGEPIRIDDLRADFERDATECVRTLTARIESALRAVTVEVRDRAHDELVEKLSRVFESGDAAADDRERMVAIARGIEALDEREIERHAELVRRIDQWIELSDAELLHGKRDSLRGAGRIAAPLLSAVVVLGLCFYYPLYRLIGFVVPRLATHPVYIASYKVIVGAAVVAMAIAFSALIAGAAFGLIPALLLVALLVAAGLITNRRAGDARLYILQRLWPGGASYDVVGALREQLVAEIAAIAGSRGRAG